MKRALPALGLTAAGLVGLLSYETRDPVDEVAISGGAVVVIPAPAPAPDPTPAPELDPTATPVPNDEPRRDVEPAPGAPTPTPTAPTATAPTPTTLPEAVALSDVFVTVEGAEIDTKYGLYQVVATFAEGELVAVEMLQLPTGRKSRTITGDAVPLFTIDALETQSADGVELVSGATVAWEAYRLSLQSALDALAQAS